MTKFKVYGAKTKGRFKGRLTIGFGLTAAVLLLGMANANAGVKSDFADPGSSVQVAALESQERLVGTEDLSRERAKGITHGALPAPGEASKVAVILWDDAWSELQRRARSASAATEAGSNVGTSIAGSYGGHSN